MALVSSSDTSCSSSSTTSDPLLWCCSNFIFMAALEMHSLNVFSNLNTTHIEIINLGNYIRRVWFVRQHIFTCINTYKCIFLTMKAILAYDFNLSNSKSLAFHPLASPFSASDFDFLSRSCSSFFCCSRTMTTSLAETKNTRCLAVSSSTTFSSFARKPTSVSRCCFRT